MRHSLMYPSVLGFAAGVLIHSFYNLEWGIVVMIAVITLLLIIHARVSNDHRVDAPISKYSLIFITYVMLFWCALGFLRFEFFINHAPDTYLVNHVNQKIDTQGIIVEEPDRREDSTRYVIKINSTKIIASAGPYASFTYGDEVKIQGTLVEPENFITEEGKEFYYQKFLQKDGILYVLKNPAFTLVNHDQGLWLKSELLKLKQKYIDSLMSAIPYPESTLGIGLTVAGKQSLPKDVLDDFKNSGTLQVVVLSGYNMTIIAEGVMWLTQTLPLHVSSSLGIVGIILFTVMTGGSATVIRGSIMAIAVIAAKLFRRRYDVTRILFITGLLMLVWNPLYLAYDPSFQLSFLATYGLITVSPIVEKRLSFVTERLKLRQAAAATIGTQLFVLPFLIYMSGDINLFAVPANLLLFLFIPITMLMCFMTGMIGFMMGFLRFLPGYTSFVLLAYELKIVHIFSHIPFATITLPYFPWWVMSVVYLSYMVFIKKFYKK